MSQARQDIPLLLLHGFLGCRDDWHDVAGRLQAGRRIAVFDLPGHGPPEDARADADCSLESASHRIEAVLESLEAPRAHILGYSLGARTALYFAVQRPDCVASLVLESGSAGIEDEADRARRRDEDEERAARLAHDGLEAFVEDWEKLPLFASQAGLAEETLAAQRRRRLGGDADALARSLRQAGTGAQPWLGDHLARVEAPVLLLCGELDDRYVRTARALQPSFPNARCAIARGAGHNVHLEDPEGFVAIVDAFLAGPAAASATRTPPNRETNSP